MTIIRNAREDEADILTDIGLRAWEAAYSSWGDPEDVRDNARQAFSEFVRRHYLAIDVAEKAGQTIGWAAREKLDNTITDLWVDPVFFRIGTGSMLLHALETEIARLGYDEAVIETHGENEAALNFLLKHGFRIRSMTTSWSSKLDRDVEVLVLSKDMVIADPVIPLAN